MSKYYRNDIDYHKNRIDIVDFSIVNVDNRGIDIRSTTLSIVLLTAAKQESALMNYYELIFY